MSENDNNQGSGLSFGSSEFRSINNDLAKCLLKLEGNNTETKTKTPTNSDTFDNPKILMINNTNNIDINLSKDSFIFNENNNIINKYKSEIYKDINYKKMYEELQIKFNELQKEYKKLKEEKENKSNSYNKNENDKFSITKLNSSDSLNIFHSSIINFDEIDEAPEDIYKSNISEINKNYRNKKLSEIFNSQMIKNNSKRKSESESNELKEKEAKIQNERREFP